MPPKMPAAADTPDQFERAIATFRAAVGWMLNRQRAIADTSATVKRIEATALHLGARWDDGGDLERQARERHQEAAEEMEFGRLTPAEEEENAERPPEKRLKPVPAREAVQASLAAARAATPLPPIASHGAPPAEWRYAVLADLSEAARLVRDQPPTEADGARLDEILDRLSGPRVDEARDLFRAPPDEREVTIDEFVSRSNLNRKHVARLKRQKVRLTAGEADRRRKAKGAATRDEAKMEAEARRRARYHCTDPSCTWKGGELRPDEDCPVCSGKPTVSTGSRAPNSAHPAHRAKK